MDSIVEELRRFITEQVLPAPREVGVEDPLVESGLVDSLGLLQILSYIDSRFGVELLRVGGPKDFRTIASLARAIVRERTPEQRA